MRQGITQRILTSLLVVGCFAVLAWLSGRLVGDGAGQVALYTVIGLVLTLLGVAAITGLNLAADPHVLRTWGYGAVWDAVVRGFLVVIPFTVMALLAELAYEWLAAQAFVQASIMTSGAAAGAELMRQAGRKTRYLIVSVIVAFVFSGVWAVFTYAFQKVAG
ncbi:MAG: hypothetical protein GXX83_04570 [Gaiellales bacterium]|nr:hypothetical protein [Gaiellales bacterium]